MASTKKSRAVPVSPKRERVVPRPFAFHWGGGNIVEEASCTGEYTQPSIQLLEYDGNAGAFGVRFCYYSHDGRYQRGPLMLDEEDVDGLRQALAATPRLRAILKRLLD